MKKEKSTLIQKIIPYLICATASTFYIYEYIVRVMPSGMAHELMQAFNMGAGGLGILGAMFFLGYAPMQIPAGILYDRFGPRKLMTVAIGIASLATIGFSLSNNFALAAGLRFITGFVSSFAYIGALIVGHSWFPRKHFALYAGSVQVFGSAGAILGSGPVAKLTQEYGWQHATQLIAYLGLFFTVLIWLIVRDNKQKQITIDPEFELPHDKKIYKKAFTNPQTWWIAAYGFFIWAPIVVFAVLWGAPYFQQAYTLSKVDAASLVSIIWIGVAIGGPLLGWFSDHIQRRRLPFILASLIGVITASLIIFAQGIPILVLIILLVLYGTASSAQAVTFGIITEVNPKKAAGAVIGFTNMAIVAGGVIFQPVVGFILHGEWNGAQFNNTPVYSTHNYQVALSLIPISFLLAFIIGAFLIKETYCQPRKPTKS